MPVEVFETDDVDAAREHKAKHFFDHSLVPTENRERFNFRLQAGRSGPLTAGLLQYGSGIESRYPASELTYSVAIATSGTFEIQIDGKPVVASPTTAVVGGPDRSAVVRGFASGSEQALLISFDRHVVESQVRNLTGVEVKQPIRIAPDLNIKSGLGAQWLEIAGALKFALNSPQAFSWNPLVSAPLSEALIIGLLLSTDHAYREALESPQQAMWPPAIKRAMSIMDERPQDPLTVTMIASEVGYSPRSLQLWFRNYLGVTPYEYLQRVRLDRVHADLVVGNPDTTSVSEIASRWGFTHLSRFAAVYRKHYHQAPSATLRDS